MQTRDTVESFYIFFPFKHFLQDRNKIDEEKKSSLTQMIVKCHLPRFP